MDAIVSRYVACCAKSIIVIVSVERFLDESRSSSVHLQSFAKAARFPSRVTHDKPFHVCSKLHKTELNESSVVRRQSRKAHLDACSSGYDDAGPRKSKPLMIGQRLEDLSWIYREETRELVQQAQQSGGWLFSPLCLFSSSSGRSRCFLTC